MQHLGAGPLISASFTFQETRGGAQGTRCSGICCVRFVGRPLHVGQRPSDPRADACELAELPGDFSEGVAGGFGLAAVFGRAA